MLSSCAGLHQASFDHAFANAVIRNDTRGIFSNCTARNANFPLNDTPPIYYAASFGNEDAIDLLYNHGASLRGRSPEGKSLVYAAAANGHTGTAQKLLALGGGTQSDLSSGAGEHRRQVAANAQAEKMQMAALAWLFVAMTSGGGGGGGSGGHICKGCGKNMGSYPGNAAYPGNCDSCVSAMTGLW